ncbi:hypothetical protein [Streptomyces marokkonensis]|uniref:hypothetical protein n=1 Tax=Streptomyces marokkonensis TaxID=324855 RepID=UPI0011F103D1|nr:hypothetical protein [Streptomyces marokkonensis]
MSENSTTATDLASQYTAQVADDLERNVKEQERVTAEIAALQEQLTVLRHDHAILVNMQQALGLVPAPAEPAGAPDSADATGAGAAPGGATVPAPRGRSGAKSGTDKPKRAKKAAARTAPGKQTRKPSAAKAERPAARAAKASDTKARETTAQEAQETKAQESKARTAGADGPKLVELVRRHLSEQSEPRSAAEVAGALTEAHPERTIKTTVVRSTLEGLVARNQVQRTKQGSSVFYTPSDAAEQAPKVDGDGS